MAAKKRKKRSTSRKKKKQKDFAGFYQEIAVLLSFAVCLFLFLSNFGLCGKVGNTVSSALFGVLGGVHYAAPVVILIMILLLISNQYNSISVKKSFFIVLLLCMTAAIWQMGTDIHMSDISAFYRYGSVKHAGGGVIGGVVSSFLYKELGLVGSYVVVFFLTVISVILITERSLLSFVKRVIAFFAPERPAEKKSRTSEKKQPKEKEDKPKTKIKAPKFPELKLGGREKKTQVLDDLTLMPEEPLKEPAKEPEKTFDLDEMIVQDDDIPIEEPEPKPRTRSFVNKDKTEPEPLQEISIHPAALEEGDYVFPPVTLLKKGKKAGGNSQAELKKTALKLEQTLRNFGVNVTITDISCGPSVTRFELQPEQGVKVSKIVGLSDDIKLNLAAPDIRIEAPIPGKAAVGIEVPNKTNQMVMFRDLIENNDFKRFSSNIAFAVGKNLAGKVIISDIAKMPHLLIAGATGSGKSVCINTLIMSILYKASPNDVKLIMIDPKVVELSTYQGIPHLLIPVVTDPKQASSALNWAVMEMGDRYKKFAEVNVRNLTGYNEKVKEMKEKGMEGEDFQPLPQIVIIVDELADLMMVAPGEVEDAIVRLSQLARAAGIHLIIATQRPSVNVITGLIKANVPSRIAFSVSSGVDSRTIIDMNGAEKLLGKGDMLFYPAGYQKPVRVQGAFISDEEVGRVVEFLKSQNIEDNYGNEIKEKIETASVKAAVSSDRDEYFEEAAKFIIDKDKASIASLQRIFKIGFNRAARLMDQLCEAGIVGEEEGTKPRKVLMSQEEFEQYKEDYL
ncbi:DNA translocase FtsK [Anaerostipes sp.]|uniref:DNA translocase FtsK n=1 Tax=Anaerostipes sp. TaxID=1872530 RepID=UPI0025BAF91C|nr:DNA translocase FtsK [Anaerostipes sp.]MBS7008489.1 DNA translocase FtsK [Anaerostipes sp.]